MALTLVVIDSEALSPRDRLQLRERALFQVDNFERPEVEITKARFGETGIVSAAELTHELQELRARHVTEQT